MLTYWATPSHVRGATILALLCGIGGLRHGPDALKGRSLFLGFVIMSQMFAPVVLLVGISTLMRMLRLTTPCGADAVQRPSTRHSPSGC